MMASWASRRAGDGDDGRETAAVFAAIGELVDVFDAAGGLEDEGFEARGDEGVEFDAERGGAGDQLVLVGEVGGGDAIDYFGGGVAEHVFGADVEDLDDAVRVGGDGGEVGAVEDGALQGASFEKNFVGAYALANLC